MAPSDVPGREEFVGKLNFEDRKNTQKVMLAYGLSKYGHRGQKRDNGERYFEHPKRVALILIDEVKRYSPEILIAALLHDIKEDSFILNWEDIKSIFGDVVYKMVYALTKDKSLEKEQRDYEYKQKLEIADEDVKIIKLADRLDNLRSLENCSPEKQENYITETLELYLPMAQEMEDYFGNYLFRELKKLCERR